MAIALAVEGRNRQATTSEPFARMVADLIRKDCLALTAITVFASPEKGLS